MHADLHADMQNQNYMHAGMLSYACSPTYVHAYGHTCMLEYKYVHLHTNLRAYLHSACIHRETVGERERRSSEPKL